MTINSETRVAGPFEGNDSTVAFPFTFKVFDSDEVRVVAATGAVETDLELGTDYTVTLNADQNAAPGGSVVLVAPLPTGTRLTLTSALEMLQPVDLTNQGGFYPRVINSALDRLTILLQQLASVVSRTLKFPLSDGPVGDLPGRSVRAGTVLAFDEATGEPVAGPDISSVNGVAGALVAINTVAGNIADVNTVADNIVDVTNFADVYYGPSASAPTTRRDASPLQVGDLYFNTTAEVLRVYDGSTWREATGGSISVHTFSGDGSTVAFDLGTAPASESLVQVFIDGVYQQRSTYSVAGTILTFDAAPPPGTGNIEATVTSVVPSYDVLRDQLAEDTNPAHGSALVGYRSRTVRARLDDVVNVKDYGAAGDGVTDDSAAISAAVSAATGGGAVYLPAGDYVLASTITISNKDVRLLGAGRDSTVLLPAADVSAIVFDFGGAAKGGWGVEHLTIKYSADSTEGSAIRAMEGLSGEISNVYIERAWNGIELGNCQSTRVEHCEMWHFLRRGIFLNDNLNDVFISDTFLNGAAPGTSTPGADSVGLHILGKAHAVMGTNIEIVQCNTPLVAVGGAAADVLKFAFSVFTGCFFDSSRFSASIQHARTNKFIGCWFSNRDTGITLQDCVDTAFVGCSFVNNDSSGCILNPGAQHTRFTNCTFDSNGQAGPGAFNGLTVAPGVSDWVVEGGLFGNLGVFGATQANGILVQPGASNRYSIRNATFSGNTASAITNGGSGTECYIEGNIGYRTSNHGTATIASGTSSVTVNHGLAVTPAPKDFQLTRGGGNGATVDLYVTNITSTQFTIYTAPASTYNMPVSWSVRTWGS